MGLETGRTAYDERAWADACRLLADAVAPEDLERLAVATHLIGRDEDSARAWEAAATAWWAANEAHRGAACAFWLAIDLLLHGQHARSTGWMARTRRVLDESPTEGVGPGFLAAHTGLLDYITGDHPAALIAFTQAIEIGRRFDHPNLLVFAQVGLGETLVRLGDVAAGIGVLDEAILTVGAADVSPINIGLAYCAGLSVCQEALDLGRAREWTQALSEWCETQPDLVPYGGQCLVHRSQVLQVDGAWDDAIEAARFAQRRLAGHPAEGEAHYQEGELLRLRGELPGAERAYLRASQKGRDPQPGLALLRLAGGQTKAALVALDRALDETSGDCLRAILLAASVEVLLRLPDHPRALAQARELQAIATKHQSAVLRARAAQSLGSVLLADGDAAAALVLLRKACVRWRELQAPYDVARVRELIGAACAALGDEEAARLEREAAVVVFTGLGARPDLERLSAPTTAVAGLTTREVEILALVAAGHTNRQIAERLVLSEHTVRRHVQNIFAKTGVSTRSAATAYAFEHHLA
jgi:DNA-binding CsgD family transcriptional regulator/tetratricopeptide (TPR) repeat protein